MTIERPVPNPAPSYEDALLRVAAMKRLDDASILPIAYTTLYDHGHQTDLCVVLLHGFTNHPGQYRQFAPQLFERGCNVFIPRLPEHGDRNRMTKRLANLTATALLRSASEAVDIAQGLGKRVVVLGISTSGLLCAYFAQFRGDVARSIPVNPVFAMLHMRRGVNNAVSRVLLWLPNFFMWWDPRNRENQLPKSGYPRFATHPLAQAIGIGEIVEAAARTQPIAARSVVMVTNRRDPAVNNAVTAQVEEAWRALAPQRVESFAFTTLPVNHDIIDPENPTPRVDIVYPKLLELIEGTP